MCMCIMSFSNNRKEVAISRVMESTVVNAICLSSLCSFSFSWKLPSPPSSSNSTFLRKHRVPIFETLQSSQTLLIKTHPRLSELHGWYSATQLLIANKGTKFHPHCLRPGFLGPCPLRRPDFQSPWASLDLQFLRARAKVDSKNWHETSAQRCPGVQKFPYIHNTLDTSKQIYNNLPIARSTRLTIS